MFFHILQPLKSLNSQNLYKIPGISNEFHKIPLNEFLEFIRLSKLVLFIFGSAAQLK